MTAFVTPTAASAVPAKLGFCSGVLDTHRCWGGCGEHGEESAVDATPPYGMCVRSDAYVEGSEEHGVLSRAVSKCFDERRAGAAGVL